MTKLDDVILGDNNWLLLRDGILLVRFQEQEDLCMSI
jgi:hypothetical protein